MSHEKTMEYKLEKYLRGRAKEAWVTLAAVTAILGIGKSSASKILRDWAAKGYVIAERVTVRGRGQPTLAYRWNHSTEGKQ